MTDSELLAKIKNGLNITGNFQDSVLQIYIDEAKAFMESAGVKKSVVNSALSVGCILQAVSDKWQEKRADYSDGFYKRLLQLAMKPELLEGENGNV